MRRALLAFALALALLTACGPAPIERADLEATIWQEGDTPPAWGPPGQILDRADMATSGALLSASRDFVGALPGTVGAAVYEDAAAAGEAFLAALPGLTEAGQAIEVGDEGKQRFLTVLFRRGRCVAQVRAPETGTDVEARTLARRLDERMGALGC